MSNLKELKPIYKVQDIINKFCVTIGMIPTSYKLSLTYEEQILAIGNYLEETIFPAINNNAEATLELQNLFIELKDYVTKYFDNLDVQKEINNKLDKMALNGELEEILNNTLFNNYETRISLQESEQTVFIGDSYGAMTEESWIEKVAQKLGLIKNQTYWKFARNGYSFARDNMKWIDLLKEEESAIPDKNKIKKFIVCGGLNDINATDVSSIVSEITNFCNYVNTNYPNAHIYIGCIGWHENPTNVDIRNQVLTKVLRAYKGAINANCSYLNGVEFPMHYYAFYGDDASHPNATGQSYIASAIFQALFGTAEFTSSPTDITSETGCHIETQILQNRLLCRLYGNITKNLPNTSEIGNKSVNIGKPNSAYCRKVNNSSYMHCTLLLNYGAEGSIITPAKVIIDENGDFIINFYNTKQSSISAIGIIDCNVEYNLLLF